jgi:hypothetical protein
MDQNPFLQTLRECLSTAQDRWRASDEVLKFGATIGLLAALLFLLLWMGE